MGLTNFDINLYVNCTFSYDKPISLRKNYMLEHIIHNIKRYIHKKEYVREEKKIILLEDISVAQPRGGFWG